VAHFLVQIEGLATTTATNTGWIIAVSPLALALLSVLFLGEGIGRSGVAGIAIATLGIALLVSGGRPAELDWLRSRGDWLVLASAHTLALYTLVTRDLVRRRPPLAVTLTILLIAGVLTAVVATSRAQVVALPALSPRGVRPSCTWRFRGSRSANGSGRKASPGWARLERASTSTWSPWPRRRWRCRCSTSPSAPRPRPAGRW
jgi:hypothetical protein